MSLPTAASQGVDVSIRSVSVTGLGRLSVIARAGPWVRVVSDDPDECVEHRV